MVALEQVIEELTSVLDRPVAEKVAQVMLSVQQQLYESLVVKRLESLEDAVRQLAQFQQKAYAEFQEYRKQTDESFRALAEAQRRTEQRVEELAQFQQKAYTEFQEYRKQTDESFRALAEAQRRTEQRVEELAQFQQKAYAEFQEYRKQTDERFRELREAQQQMYAEFQEYRKQTDERFRELREAQQQMYAEFQEYRKQTDERFRELAEAQKRTDQQIARLEEQVSRLVEAQLRTQEEIRDIRRQLGGLSQTVGYTLENEAMKRLPDLLRERGIRVEGRLTRRYVRDSQGNYIEVNIFGTGYRDGERVTLVGESKSQLSKNDIDRFLRRTVSALQAVYPNIVPLLVTHFTSEPDAEEYARAQGVLVYYSYEF
jgi:DNA repair exonuclease SbcCD ATPase subunit